MRLTATDSFNLTERDRAYLLLFDWFVKLAGRPASISLNDCEFNSLLSKG